jgi:hypothetical protein
MTRPALKLIVGSATVLLICVPIPARADGYVAPFVGANFANNSGNGRSNFGANVGWMSGGVIGLEADLGYSPSFFGNQGVYGSNNVLDLMGNVIVGVPVGTTHHTAGVRPYGTIGFGLLRSQLNAGPTGAARLTNNDPGLDAGAGVMGLLSEHVGLRGDVRYFRDVHGDSMRNGFGIDFGSFHFWRASFGVVIR